MDLSIQPYNSKHDEAFVYHLWRKTLNDQWPLSAATFRAILSDATYEVGDHWLAYLGQQPVGFVATQPRRHQPLPPTQAGLLVIMVEPAYQRRGIGRWLLEVARQRLAGLGVSRLHLGSGGRSYFWPGIPLNLPAAVAFFRACGWSYHEQSVVDMIRDVSTFKLPEAVIHRVADQGIRLGLANAADTQPVLAFEQQYFPNWLPYFEQAIAAGDWDDILIACEQDNTVVGSVLLFAARPAEHRPETIWRAILGEDMGGFGVLGVGEPCRDRGIGLALAAQATHLLKERRVRTSYLSWTWLVDWYGQLGYRVWREYLMSWRQV